MANNEQDDRERAVQQNQGGVGRHTARGAGTGFGAGFGSVLGLGAGATLACLVVMAFILMSCVVLIWLM